MPGEARTQQTSDYPLLHNPQAVYLLLWQPPDFWLLPAPQSSSYLPPADYVIQALCCFNPFQLFTYCWGSRHTVKKVYRISRPPPGCHLPNSARESLVSDIPAGDGKIASLFLQCSRFFGRGSRLLQSLEAEALG